MTPTAQLVLIIAAAIVVVFIAVLFRNRLTEGTFKGNKDGIEATIRAASPNTTSPVQIDDVDKTPDGVVIKGIYTNSTINRVAGRDIVEGKSVSKPEGDTPGVTIDGEFRNSDLTDIAGRDNVTKK